MIPTDDKGAVYMIRSDYIASFAALFMCFASMGLLIAAVRNAWMLVPAILLLIGAVILTFGNMTLAYRYWQAVWDQENTDGGGI